MLRKIGIFAVKFIAMRGALSVAGVLTSHGCRVKKELPQLLAVEVAFKTRAGLGINLLRGCLPEKIKIVPGLVLLVFPDTILLHWPGYWILGGIIIAF